jgi:hypothetical protein
MNRGAQLASQLIIDAWRRGRPIVPFLGAGLSVAAGFPTRKRLTAYLAKVQFALDQGIYHSRYPVVSEAADTATERYRRRPAEFITDFGWPEIGQLNADMWGWLSDESDEKAIYYTQSPHSASVQTIRTHKDIIQWVYQKQLSEAEPDLADVIRQSADGTPTPLHGDWTAMLEHLTEGQFGLIDSLFAGLDQGREPTLGHIYLAFLANVMGIRLILSTNFDTLLEKAMGREGIAPRVFDIHRDADLPHPGIVRKQLSLVKLHGSAYGLRFGERLQYALEMEARNRICGYVPDDALMIVLGFSGFERRMMQAIAHIATRSAEGRDPLQVLWLSPDGGSESSPFMRRLVADLRDQGLMQAFVPHAIGDANTFLSELAFRVGSSFPAFRHKYDALICRPMFLNGIDLAPNAALAGSASVTSAHGFPSIDSPAVIVLSDPPLDERLEASKTHAPPSTWPSLAAAQLASKDRDRDVIWVDLELHHSVEGVIRDVLAQIRRVDPEAPQLVLPTDLLLGTAKDTDRGLVKPVERIREALQRGM